MRRSPFIINSLFILFSIILLLPPVAISDTDFMPTDKVHLVSQNDSEIVFEFENEPHELAIYKSEYNITYLALPPTGEPVLEVEEVKGVYYIENMYQGEFSKGNYPPALESLKETFEDERQLKAIVSIKQTAQVHDMRICSIQILPRKQVRDEGLNLTALISYIRVKIKMKAMPSESPPGRKTYTGKKEKKPGGMDRILSRLLVNYEASSDWRYLSHRSFGSEVGAPSKGFRFDLKEPGVYALTGLELEEAGINPAKIDISSINLTLRKKSVHTFFLGGDDNKWDPEDKLIFYAEPGKHPYSEYVTYWLAWDDEPGPAIESFQPKEITPDENLEMFKHVFRLEEDKIDVSSVRDNFLETHGNWFWFQFGKDDRKTIDLPHEFQTSFKLRAIDPFHPDIKLKIAFYTSKRNSTENAFPAIIYLNNRFLEKITWGKRQEKIWEITVPATMLNSGENNIRIRSPKTEESYLFYLSWIELEYMARFAPLDLPLELDLDPSDLNRRISIADAPEGSIVIRRPEGTDPTYIRNQGSRGLAWTEAPGSKKVELDIYAPDHFKKVKNIIKARKYDLLNPKNKADCIIVAPYEFAESAERLAKFREKQGYDIVIAYTRDIYDLFNYGMQSPRAIQDFLAYAQNNWKLPVPQHVLLFGDGKWDYQNHINPDVPNWVPPFRYENDILDFSSDQDYVYLHGDDKYPDMVIGRLSVETMEEAESVVNKVINYEKNPVPGEWRNRVLAVSDDGFEHYNETVIEEYLPEYLVPYKIGLDHFPLEFNSRFSETMNRKISPKTKEEIIREYSKGSLFMEYFGHGGGNVVAHESILFGGGKRERSDIQKMTNDGKPPFMAMMTCFNGYFDYSDTPWNYCISEDFLRKEGGGAIAILAPTSMGGPHHHNILMRYSTQSLFKNTGLTIGEAITEGRVIALISARGSNRAFDMFVFFGDPLTRIAEPEEKLIVEAIPNEIRKSDKHLIKVKGNLADSKRPSGKIPLAINLIRAKDGNVIVTSKLELEKNGFEAEIEIPRDIEDGIYRVSAYAWTEKSDWAVVGKTIFSYGTPELGLYARQTTIFDKETIRIDIKNTSNVKTDDLTLSIYPEAAGETTRNPGEIHMEHTALSSNFAPTIHVPIDWPPGAYNARIVLRENRETAPQETSINIPVIIKSESEKPDLALLISDLIVAPEQPVINEDVSISLSIYSTSTTPLDKYNIQLEDENGNILKTIETSDTTIERKGKTSFSVPAGDKIGERNWRIIADPENRIEEEDETNNSLDFPVKVYNKPNLVLKPEYIKVLNPNPYETETVFFKVKLENTGGSQAENVRVVAYDKNPDAGGVQLSRNININNKATKIGAGESIELDYRWDPAPVGEDPAPLMNAGDHNLFFEALMARQSFEADPSDNTALFPLHIRTRPMYSVPLEEVDYSVVPAGPDSSDGPFKVTLKAYVHNDGETDVEKLLIYFKSGTLSRPSRFNDQLENEFPVLGRTFVYDLKAQSKVEFSTELEVPDGHRYAYIVLDPLQDIGESGSMKVRDNATTLKLW